VKAKLIRDMPRPKGQVAPAGEVIDHPNAWRLVRMGVAEPADDECRAKADMSPEKMERAKVRYERTDLGIHPEDFAAFDSGWMVGYDHGEGGEKTPQRDALGNTSNVWKPGPKWGEYAALLDARENELLEDEADDEEGE
jgi:hypothetical protein